MRKPCVFSRAFLETAQPDVILLAPPPEVARELPFRDGNADFSLILKRNCSISPAWLVLPFAGLEIAALVAAKERLRI